MAGEPGAETPWLVDDNVCEQSGIAAVLAFKRGYRDICGTEETQFLACRS